MKFVLYYLAFLISVGSLNAQHTMSGKVLDAAHQPIPGATVKIHELERGDVTNAEGEFTIGNVAADNVTLEIRAVNQKVQKLNVTLPLDHQLEIVLEESTIDLEQVVVTGTMQPVFIKDSPVKVEVITGEHLNTFMPSAASSVMESVQLINGVQEVVACGVCFTNSISINGLPGPYTAVLMDGTPIYGNLASVYGLNGIPNMIIDRIEVIKGPNSTLYGSEAVAGVINIITKDPAEQPTVNIDLMGTTHGESFGNIAVAPSIGNTHGYIGLNYAYINNFDDENNDGFSDLINLDRYSLFSKWDIHRNSGKRFTVAGKFFYEDRRNGVEEFLENRNYRNLRGNDEIYGESIYTNRLELFGTYEFDLPFNLKLDYSLTHHDQDSYYGSDHYTARQDIAFGNFIYEKQSGNHSFLGGVTLRYQYYDDNTVATEVSMTEGVVNNPDEQFIPGVFAQDEWSVTDNFTILSGLRVDQYKRHGLIFSPRLNIKASPGEWTTFRINAGTGFRIVNLFTEDHAFITGQREVVLQEELNPEESYNVAANLNHIYTLGGSQGMIDFDVFYTHFTNKIIPDYETPGQIIYANSDGFARSRGVGMNITQEFIFPLSLTMGFNYQQVTETDADGEQRDIEFAPDWTGVFTANYDLKKAGLNIGYSVTLTGPMQLPEVFDLNASTGELLNEPRPIRSATYALHNIQINKMISKKFSVYGGMQNIFNFMPEFSPLVGFNDPNANPGFSTNFDTAYAFAPVHGREFYIGLNVRF